MEGTDICTKYSRHGIQTDQIQMEIQIPRNTLPYSVRLENMARYPTTKALHLRLHLLSLATCRQTIHQSNSPWRWKVGLCLRQAPLTQ